MTDINWENITIVPLSVGNILINPPPPLLLLTHNMHISFYIKIGDCLQLRDNQENATWLHNN